MKPLRDWKVLDDLRPDSLRVADVQRCSGVPRRLNGRLPVDLAVEVASGIVYRKGMPTSERAR